MREGAVEWGANFNRGGAGRLNTYLLEATDTAQQLFEVGRLNCCFFEGEWPARTDATLPPVRSGG